MDKTINERIQPKKRNGLAVKLIIGIVLIALLVSTASVYIGAKFSKKI